MTAQPERLEFAPRVRLTSSVVREIDEGRDFDIRVIDRGDGGVVLRQWVGGRVREMHLAPAGRAELIRRLRFPEPAGCACLLDNGGCD